MGVDVKAYRGLFVSDDAEKIGIETAGLNVSELRAAFRHAGKGEDVITQERVNELSGRDTILLRSDTEAKIKDFAGFLDDIVSALEKEARTGNLSAEKRGDLENDINLLATHSGIDARVIKSIADYTARHMQTYQSILDNDFPVSGNVPGSALTRAIARGLNMQSYGELGPEESKKLTENLVLYAKENKLDEKAMQLEITTYVDYVKGQDERTLVKTVLNDQINSIRSADGMEIPGTVAFMAVANYYSTDKKTPFFGLLPKEDMPTKKPPFTPDQFELLAAIHEGAHIKQNAISDIITAAPQSIDMKVPGYFTAMDIKQATEISADAKMLKFLDDLHEPKMKEFWLRSRQVMSFTYDIEWGEKTKDLEHDTATFLRLYEKTGRQLDIPQFREQKAALLDRVYKKIGGKEAGKIGDLMGAVQDVLKEDSAEKDPDKKLTPVQKAEAELFLGDAKALGYKANPNYPKPQIEAAPVASLPAMTPGF